MIGVMPLAAGTMSLAVDVKGPVRNMTTKFVNSIPSSADPVLLVVGGGIALVCIIGLLAKWWWPQSAMARWVQGSKVAFAIVGLILGVVIAAPRQILPFMASIVGMVADVIVNLFGRALGVN